MSILQLPWDPWLPPSITLPDISQKLNDSTGLSEVVLECRNIFVPQKALLITLYFDLRLNIYIYIGISHRTEIVIFLFSSVASLAIAHSLTL